jgi:hypothetical protein
MSDPTPAEQRRRWINIGEIVAVAGLAISGLALWNSWGKGDDKPVVVKEEKAIPLVLRGKVEDGGKAIRLTPLEDSHALEDVTIAAAKPGSGSASFGSEPVLSAAGIEDWLPDDAAKEGVGSLPVVITTRYVEHGATRQSRGRYRIRYGWSDGGLLSGKSLRLTGFSRG